MANKLTKNSEVYDRSKVGVGDIVEFDEYGIRLFGNRKFLNKRVGIVTMVEADALWVRTQDNYNTGALEEFGIPVEQAGKVRLVYRSYYNVKKEEEA